MSIWTHVAGTIRIDSLDRNDVSKKNIICVLSGIECANGVYETIKIQGSEGGLEFIIAETYEKFRLNAYNIMIYGDLRNYDEPEKVIQWFKSCCDRLNEIGMLVRCATITSKCEEGEEKSLSLHY